MQKMTLEDLKELYPPYDGHHQKAGRDGKVNRSHATQKNHRHVVNPVWLPAIPRVSPAEYRRHNRR